MASLADLATDNPNIRSQYDDWRSQRVRAGNNSMDYRAFRQHVIDSGSHDPGEREPDDFDAPAAVATPTQTPALVASPTASAAVASPIPAAASAGSSGEGQPVQTMPFRRGWFVALGVLGLLLLGALPPVGVILLAISAIYLLWSIRRVHPKTEQRKAAAVDQAKAALQSAAKAGQRGAAVVAYRNLCASAERLYRKDARAKVAEALASIGVDARSLESPQIGVIPTLQGRDKVEVFRDWIIYGQEAHDVDANTRGNVYMDGSVQVLKKAQHDLRTAQLQLVSNAWSMGVPIHPDQANAARLIVAQLAVHVDSLKPQGVTAQDIRAMVDTILNNTGQPPAEKLQQLSNLRFQRLLSDEEFEQAKSRILGIS